MSLSFEVLCVTMNQNDFSKIQEMNLNCNVFFSNQSDCTKYEEIKNEQHLARMLTTSTCGVGINRNFGLIYANADICLLADDDMYYVDNLESIVVKEFEKCPNADVIIFNVDTDNNSPRPQKKYFKTRRTHIFERMPWGGVRIAFRLNSIKKSGVMFTTLFGGGSVFACGEDSIFLKQLKKNGLKFYVSKEIIGKVSFGTSSWFTGRDENYFYARGAFIQCLNKRLFWLYAFYYAIRIGKNAKLSFINRIKWMRNGRKGYDNVLSYKSYLRGEYDLHDSNKR